jgi:hypothetical protein
LRRCGQHGGDPAGRQCPPSPARPGRGGDGRSRTGGRHDAAGPVVRRVLGSEPRLPQSPAPLPPPSPSRDARKGPRCPQPRDRSIRRESSLRTIARIAGADGFGLPRANKKPACAAGRDSCPWPFAQTGAAFWLAALLGCADHRMAGAAERFAVEFPDLAGEWAPPPHSPAFESVLPYRAGLDRDGMRPSAYGWPSRHITRGAPATSTAAMPTARAQPPRRPGTAWAA